MRFIHRVAAYVLVCAFLLISLVCLVMTRNALYPPLKNAINTSTPITQGAADAAAEIETFTLLDLFINASIIGLAIIGVISILDLIFGSHEEEYEPYQYPPGQGGLF